ncbi:DUF632 domain-containing protein/DUF630 domain-containing protein [Cephalotus follicularis]|uniref:DUF632 domain-containing protein/DUF630 domain-containing protein n=1 Tax=Cephalotus follicularis TaxID=3775 RepID=A0A1Q3C1I5_CEPFO|nr:DUF632 domain-containing protein/DUF630 domain-containing protein [Cephalotus follicularis]
MGCANSKTEKNEALRLCKERRRFIKQAIDSRYALAAAHVSYIQSLKSIGIALRRYAEAEVLIESSLSTSAFELDKTPSHSPSPSPSPSHVIDISDSPLQNESLFSTPPTANLGYMKQRRSASVTLRVNANSSNGFVEDETSGSFPMAPPPPPFESGSWDYFDPNGDDCESFKFVGHNGLDMDFDDMGGWKQYRGEGVDGSVVEAKGKSAIFGLDGSNGVDEGNVRAELEQKGLKFSNFSATQNASYVRSVSSGAVDDYGKAVDGEGRQLVAGDDADRFAKTMMDKAGFEQSSSKREKSIVEKDLAAERDDPSEFITHRAKDFLPSIKDIEHRFFRASESGREVSRMLEANKIRVGFSEAKGKSAVMDFLESFQLVCCSGKGAVVSHEPVQNVKVITWKRSASSRSSSSRNPLAAASKDDNDDSGSDFVEEFCMIAGSHSSTLDRLFAWERKLFDEVKASESIRKEYDLKCDQLRHQFAKDHSSQVIDKTRAVVKDLHSRIRVALHSVDSISKRIEKMRDEELQPQLLELIQGLIRMWKAMLECHHSQYITISLAYHSRYSTGTPQGDTHKQILAQLQQEIECFGISFADWINSITSYVEALNGWLQLCILHPPERSKSRRPFSPRRVLAPPIFVLCRDWSAGFKSLPSEELSNATKNFLSDLHHLMDQQAEQLHSKDPSVDPETGGVSENKDDDKTDVPSILSCIHTSLTKVLDWLNKFSEASLKMYEDIKLRSDAAHNDYLNYRPARL